ncbi:sensor domain-containing diguanylate cyclase [Wenzhouxiangella limi]|uniref:Diguanylate cyclase n=1 Tax=Wenzhouxiangella limi TaxID=2707351 RepID=A0A845V2S7_9GAMM|nr:sensor domain-containing diguanylate cyclase [Wenzhouxiangella limi]NDY94571.1 diguanylate cyclase [Wenzhouxiangella limi]
MTEITLPDGQRLLDAILEQAFNSVVITDARFDHGGPLIEKCNPAFCRMTGYPAAELIGQSPRILQGPETDPAVIERLRNCLHEGRFFQGATVNYRKDGTPYNVEWNISPIRDSQGAIRHFVSLQQNITARVQAESERNLMARALNVARDPILITDAHARIVFANQAFEQLTGYESTEILGRTPKFLQSGQQADDFYSLLKDALARGQAFRATFANLRKGGDIYYADQSITPINDAGGTVRHFVSISKDVTHKVMQEQQLSEEASRDPLTGLFNRRTGERILARAHQAATTDDRPFAVLIADIDHFKQVNDQHGHASGDRVLQQVANVMKNQIRETDRAIRWGGEEFLVVLDNASKNDALSTAERIRAAVEAISDFEVGPITLSLGCGQWQPVESPEALVRRVDIALYAAKKSGRNRVQTAANGSATGPGDAVS